MPAWPTPCAHTALQGTAVSTTGTLSAVLTANPAQQREKAPTKRRAATKGQAGKRQLEQQAWRCTPYLPVLCPPHTPFIPVSDKRHVTA